ncbi:hypothetical protein [Halomonas sp. NO4]|uniref:hypothetical protein n=1 Tax=Halomonas sp. NO4 TaxID=2484813 RepID=UPI0013CF52E6|nr:hypothetical protein [Halomonas sp. NO4]
MDKPRLRAYPVHPDLSVRYWHCRGQGLVGYGMTPDEALYQWQLSRQLRRALRSTTNGRLPCHAIVRSS